MAKPVVLLVEDEPAHAELVARAFEAKDGGFRLSVAGTLAEARSSLQRERPNLIITDWLLPDGKGLELIAPDSSIPVILITSYGNERIAVEAIKAGALDYVVKSEATFADMPHIAERACREWDLRLQQQRVEGQLQRRVAELEAVNRISTALRQIGKLSDMLPLLLDQTLQALSAQDGMIWLLPTGQSPAGSGVARGWLAQAELAQLRADEGIPRLILETNQPLRVHDFATDSATWQTACGLPGSGYSGMCMPLRTSEGLVGIMSVSTPLPRELNEGEIHLLNTVAEIAGSAIHRMRLHEQTERSLQRLAALHTIDMAITSSIDINFSLNVILDQVLAQLGADAACILQVNRHTQTLEYRAGRGFNSTQIQKTRLRMGEGYAGRAALNRSRFHISSLSAANPQLPPGLIAAENLEGYCVTPLIAKGNIKGVLEIFQRSPLNPDANWFSYLEALANQAALAIDNWELFERLQRSNIDLTLAYDATIEGWSRALDLRDRETEGHTLRVTEQTLRLARLLQVPEDDLIHIRRGALLHDIGKMGIPDNILLKPGPLTEEEWAIMHQHPVYAYEMLSPIAYLNQALDIPRCHHERWDGSGYPGRLREDQIPLPARIFAVVDVWDALRSDRPYREAWSDGRVREYLQASAGTLFDPQIVTAFLGMNIR